MTIHEHDMCPECNAFTLDLGEHPADITYCPECGHKPL